jgi:hypothetical protein
MNRNFQKAERIEPPRDSYTPMEASVFGEMSL